MVHEQNRIEPNLWYDSVHKATFENRFFVNSVQSGLEPVFCRNCFFFPTTVFSFLLPEAAAFFCLR